MFANGKKNLVWMRHGLTGPVWDTYISSAVPWWPPSTLHVHSQMKSGNCNSEYKHTKKMAVDSSAINLRERQAVKLKGHAICANVQSQNVNSCIVVQPALTDVWYRNRTTLIQQSLSMSQIKENESERRSMRGYYVGKEAEDDKEVVIWEGQMKYREEGRTASSRRRLMGQKWWWKKRM